mgnify:FL=1
MNEYGTIKENVSLKDYTTFKIGGTCKYLIEVNNKNSLIKLIDYLKNNSLKYYILGNGSNVILDDNYLDGVIIKLNKLNKISINDNFVTAECGVKLGFLNNVCLQNGLVSLSFASLIPGEVGASIKGNAGCYNKELLNYVYSVEVLDNNGNVKNILKSDIKYGYRFTDIEGLILSATFILEKGDPILTLKEMKENNDKRLISQPLDMPSVGSIFKNPENMSAGKLIDDLGLKGYHINDAYVSEKHANFIVNKGSASFDDVIKLIDYIIFKVKEKYGVTLEVEPKIVWWNKLWKSQRKK